MRLRILLLTVFSLSLFWIMPNANAQEKDKDYIPTQNTAPDARPDPKTQGPKEKKIRYIITNDTKNTLAGNRCFEEATHEMGFEYMAVPKGQIPNYDGVTRWFHNFGVKFILVFKNGPFWKRKVNKKYKDCRFNSGDYIGSVHNVRFRPEDTAGTHIFQAALPIAIGIELKHSEPDPDFIDRPYIG